MFLLSILSIILTLVSIPQCGDPNANPAFNYLCQLSTSNDGGILFYVPVISIAVVTVFLFEYSLTDSGFIGNFGYHSSNHVEKGRKGRHLKQLLLNQFFVSYNHYLLYHSWSVPYLQKVFNDLL
jgi:hypothetical protein